MDNISKWHDRKLKRLQARMDGMDAEQKRKVAIAMHRLRRQMRLDAKKVSDLASGYGTMSTDGVDDEKGAWRTTQTGKHIFIQNGEVTKGNAEIVNALNGEGGDRSSNSGSAHKNEFREYYENTPKRRGIRVKGMSAREVTHVRKASQKLAKKNYDKALEKANLDVNKSLWTYTSHNADHIEQVVEKTNQACDAIDKMQGENGLYSHPIDRKMMLIAAEFHDTGMDGDDTDYPDGDALRKDHALNSAIALLQNSKEVEKLGVNPSRTALLIFSHTKSNSEIEDLSKPESWKAGLDKLENAVSAFNEKHPDAQIEFKREDVFGGEPDSENIKILAGATAALRLGDANREANIPLFSQAGGKYEIEKMPSERRASADTEAKFSKIAITLNGERHELSADDPKMSQVPAFDYSKKVVLGERNMMQADAFYDRTDDSIGEHIKLGSGNNVPYCTVIALKERLGELATINGAPRKMKITMSGVDSVRGMSAHAIKAYRKMIKDIRTEKDKKGNLKYEGIDSVIFEFDDGSVREIKIDSKDNLRLKKG